MSSKFFLKKEIFFEICVLQNKINYLFYYKFQVYRNIMNCKVNRQVGPNRNPFSGTPKGSFEMRQLWSSLNCYLLRLGYPLLICCDVKSLSK